MSAEMNTQTCTSRSKNSKKAKNALLRRIHILQWLPKYTKFDLLSDFIAGLTVGMMMIPQAIAYAGIASLPAQYGLYTAFIGSYTYVFFGTIAQVSIGPTSLLAMITFSYVENCSLDYVFLLTFLAGCVELCMGLLKLGFLVDFISPAVLAGFTSGISITIIFSQMNSLLGLSKNGHNFIGVIHMIATHIQAVKLSDTTLGLCSILFLLLLKEITRIKTQSNAVKKTLWFISISRNALIVLITSFLSYHIYKAKGKTPFAISGQVPSGLPDFSPPKFWTVEHNKTVSFFGMIETMNTGILVVPICAILSNIGIAKSFASGVIVDSSQEMITLGLSNILGSCVKAMPSSGAFSRSAVANASGVRTPMQGLFSGTIIILALNFLTPYFFYIPKATLAAVLISAVSTMIDYKILHILWRTNKHDAFFFMSTCCVSVFAGADTGIIVGALLNLVVLLKEWSRPKINIKICPWGKHSREYVLVKPEFGLCYPARDYLLQKIIKARNDYANRLIVLDCSKVLKIDHAIAQALVGMLDLYNESKVGMVLINLNDEVLRTLKNFTSAEKMKFCQSNSELEDDLFNDEDELRITLLKDP